MLSCNSIGKYKYDTTWDLGHPAMSTVASVLALLLLTGTDFQHGGFLYLDPLKPVSTFQLPIVKHCHLVGIRPLKYLMILANKCNLRLIYCCEKIM